MRDLRLIGVNIRKYRKRMGMTQAALAERLFVTAQNISKWETGLSIPDVEKLCLLADVLGVSIDRLLSSGEQRVEGRLMIGIDGGGTKTEFCLFSERGEVICRRILEGSNPNISGINSTNDILRRGIDLLMSVESDISAIYAGIAGCGVSDQQRTVRAFLRKLYPGVRIEVGGDVLNVIYSTERSERCIAAILGTGSVVCAKQGAELHRLGGWGYLFDHSASGYDFGRDAIRAALAEEEGSGERTRITALLTEALGGSIHDKLSTLYHAGTDKIAAYAGIVFEAYRQGDKIASDILLRNTGYLYKLLLAAARMYDCGNCVVLAGGLMAEREILLRFLSEHGNDFTYVCPRLPQIYGACVCCSRLLGEPAADFATTFEKSYLTQRGAESC